MPYRRRYCKEGAWLPGKRGISLSPADWATICKHEAAITTALASGNEAYVLRLSGRRQVRVRRQQAVGSAAAAMRRLRGCGCRLQRCRSQHRP